MYLYKFLLRASAAIACHLNESATCCFLGRVFHAGSISPTRYGLSGELLKDFECLCEIRNEIVHPVPLPTGTHDNWPEYLRRVKNKKLLIEHSDPNTHFTFFGQLASQELFAWAVRVTHEAYKAVIRSVPDRGMLLQFFLTTFGNFSPDQPPRASVPRNSSAK